ncbi:hypothetical protein AMR42_02920 [Limnothrix sp. PR1529]|nr:hypothetical protein BCR12_08175 [Limnothrix sp. P13C2]PIB15081.1 hypothetical protein AMR42_02920 [Limnothrix sp. PR1529]
MGLPTLTRAIATTLSIPGNTQGSRELGGENPPLRLIGLKNEVIRVSGDLTIGPKSLVCVDHGAVQRSNSDFPDILLKID